MNRIAPASALFSTVFLLGCVQSQPSGTLASGGASESAATQPASSVDPPLEHMTIAHAVGKVSVPVDVRYLASGAPVRGQQMTLQLAFTPRIEGENLKVEFPASDSVSIESGGAAFTQQKANVTGVIRRSLLVTPREGNGGEVRVIVSMEAQGGRYFGIFSCPLD